MLQGYKAYSFEDKKNEIKVVFVAKHCDKV